MFTRHQVIAQHRKCIRREAIQSLFAAKRKLFSAPQSGISHSLVDLLDSLGDRSTLAETLNQLVLILAQDDPFLRYSDQPASNEQVQQYCIALAEIVLERLFPTFNTDKPEDVSLRLLSLNVLINLLAEVRCPNHLLSEDIIVRISLTYESVEIWGIDDQIVEVGWLLGNLLRKDIWHNQSQKITLKMLEWLQELVSVGDYSMQSSLLRGINMFWGNLDRQVGRTCPILIPQHFKPNRVNLLEKIIRLSLGSERTPEVLTSALQFIAANIECVFLHCGEECFETLLEKSAKIFGTTSWRTQEINCTLLKRAVRALEVEGEGEWEIKRFNKKAQMARAYITGKYSKIMLIHICQQDIRSKQSLLELLLELLSPGECLGSSRAEVVRHFVEQELEEVLGLVVRTNDNDLVLMCFHIVSIILEATNREHGTKFIREIEKFTQRSGRVGEVAALILQQHRGD